MKTCVFKGLSLLFLLLFFGTNSIKAQSGKLTGMTIYMEIDSNSVSSYSDTVISSNVNLYGHVVIEITDALDISKIHIKMGSVSGGNDLYLQTFNFDINTNLPSGSSYQREGNVIYLGIGSFIGLNHFFAEATTEDLIGTVNGSINYAQ